MTAQLRRLLFQPISIMPLVFFRVAFGGVMIWEVWRYFRYNRIERYYMDPIFNFHYYGFHWVKPFPGDGMNIVFLALAFLAGAVIVGFAYRVSTTVVWLLVTYIFLLDETQYLNHFYLMSLISFLMIFVPAHRFLSVDSWLRPSIHTPAVPGWSLWLLRGQMTVVYVYGGLAKINTDWLRGEPMRGWLANRTDFPAIGHLFTEEWMVFAFSYGGLLFDLFIVPLLLWRWTRIPALLIAAGFHWTNDTLFNIGVFPVFAMAATLIFLPAHWFKLRLRPPARLASFAPRMTAARWAVAGLMGVYVAVQLLVPLRHHTYPGVTAWTDQGHNLSWRMKLRSKTGYVYVYYTNPTTGVTTLSPTWEVLNDRQTRKMSDNPDMLLRYAHWLAAEYETDTDMPADIRYWSMMGLNNRARQLLIDPTAPLNREADTLRGADWILPLVQPPAPHPGYPALLISRRQEGAMLLINMTEYAFPLGDVTLHDSDTEYTFADYNPTLAVQHCVLMYEHDAALVQAAPICQLNSWTQTELPAGTFDVALGGEIVTTCDSPTCVVVDQRYADPPEPILKAFAAN